MKEFGVCSRCERTFKVTWNATLCPACNNERVKAQPEEVKMYRRAKSRAKAKGIPFDIEPDDVVIPTHCPILGIPIDHVKGKPGAFRNSPSLDRIDPSMGYVKGNVWVISMRANAMKGDATVEDMQAFARWVQAAHPERQENVA
jgi:hypothetical protein